MTRLGKGILFFACLILLVQSGLLGETPPPPSELPLPSSEQMTDSYKHAFTKMVLSLACLVFLLVGTIWFLRRMSRGKFRFGRSEQISILEKKSLSPKTVLYSVKIRGKEILIAESQLEVRALATLEENNPDTSS